MQNERSRAWRIAAGAAGTAIAAYGLRRIVAKIAPATIEREHVVTIRKDPAELFALWTDFARAPEWMHGVREVISVSPGITHWVVEGPGGGTTIEYDAEIIDEVPDELIAWKSTDDSSVRIYGEIHFVPTSRGTELRCSVAYDAPVGLLGVAAAGMTGLEPTTMLKEHLRRFKMLAEAGEVATNEGPSARQFPHKEPGTLIKRGLDIGDALRSRRVTRAARFVRGEDRP